MFPCMKLRHLETILQEIDVFEKPKVHLEQYPTPPHLGAHMLHVIQSEYGDIDGKLVADLGCGCGALSIGTAALNAAHVVGFDIDADALQIFLDNMDEDVSNVEVIHADALNLSPRWENIFDTVIMNPPFGTKNNAGIDIKFLESAFYISNNVVYSLHKTSTRAHILKVAKEKGVNPTILAQLRYNLPSTMRFHKKNLVDIEVDFYRFIVTKS